MLAKTRSFFEYLKSSWNASESYADDFQLSLYAAIEDEFDSGNIKKGLFAKVNVECNYNENAAKAKYIKIRVEGILIRKDEISALFHEVRALNEKLKHLKESISLIEEGIKAEIEPSRNDFKIAEENFSRKRFEEKSMIGSFSPWYYFIIFAVSAGWLSITFSNIFMILVLPGIVALYLGLKEIRDAIVRNREIDDYYTDPNNISEEAKKIFAARLKSLDRDLQLKKANYFKIENKITDCEEKFRMILS